MSVLPDDSKGLESLQQRKRIKNNIDQEEYLIINDRYSQALQDGLNDFKFISLH